MTACRSRLACVEVRRCGGACEHLRGPSSSTGWTIPRVWDGDALLGDQIPVAALEELSVTPSNCFGQSSSYGGLGYTYEWGVNGPAEVNGSYTESTATLLGTGAGTGYFSCMVTSNYNVFVEVEAENRDAGRRPVLTRLRGSRIKTMSFGRLQHSVPSFLTPF